MTRISQIDVFKMGTQRGVINNFLINICQKEKNVKVDGISEIGHMILITYSFDADENDIKRIQGAISEELSNLKNN